MILKPTWLVPEIDQKKLQSDNVFYILVRYIDADIRGVNTYIRNLRMS